MLVLTNFFETLGGGQSLRQQKVVVILLNIIAEGEKPPKKASKGQVLKKRSISENHTPHLMLSKEGGEVR